MLNIQLSLLLVIINIILISSNRLTRFSFFSLATTSKSLETNSTNSKDGVCDIPSKVDSITSLKERILSEWNDAGVKDNNSATTTNSDINEEFDEGNNVVLSGIPLDLNTLQDTAKTTLINNTSTTTTNKQIETVEATQTHVDELVKLGWLAEDAKKALTTCNNDMIQAATLLENDEEEKIILRNKLKELINIGNWDEQAAAASLLQCEGNVTLANDLLLQEEITVQENFDLAVKDMKDNGWAEVVARQALLAQWNLDQRKALGGNVTVSDDILQSIKPSLHRRSETTKTNKDNNKLSSTSASSEGATPKPAKKEDVVFEITSNNFQKIVLESPIPVILDIYADWCGPCKQLGPILEQAAIKSGGMFRLAKVNSDHENAIAQTLGVTGLPSVFTVKQGKITDNFIGMLPTEDLQSYLVRAVTGYDDRSEEQKSTTQSTHLTPSELQDLTMKISQLSGLASISFKKKEKLNTMIEDTMLLEGAFKTDTNILTDGLKTALQYINNCRNDIRNPKYRIIKTNTKAYTEYISNNPSALQLIDIAGFKIITTATNTANTSTANISATNQPSYELVHYNAAILTIVVQKVDSIINDRKFAKMKNPSTTTSSSTGKPFSAPNSQGGSD